MFGVEIKPRAKLTVFTWLSSVRAFESIFAAASELEKRGGRLGRGLGELLKKRGEGGWRSEWNPEGPKEKLSRKCRERGFTPSFRFFVDGSDVGARPSCGERSARFLVLLPLELGVMGGGKSEGGVFATACDTLALRPFARLPGLCLPLPFSLCLNEFHTDVFGACSFWFGLWLSSNAFKDLERSFSGSDRTSGAASAAAWMRFFSRASGVLCLRKGELVSGARAGVFEGGGSGGLLTKNASREVKILGLLELIGG
jgi:hypothetical protein